MEYDFDELLEDRRCARIKVCLDHGGLYDDRPDSQTGRQQLCHDREDQERWDGFDFNEWIRLCDCCVTALIRSGSRWSTVFCDHCLQWIREEHLGIPIGRHSMMSGIGMPPLDDVRTMVSAVDSLFERVKLLQRWKAERVQQIGVRFAAGPYLDEFLGVALDINRNDVGLLVDWWKAETGWEDPIIANARVLTPEWKASGSASEE